MKVFLRSSLYFSLLIFGVFVGCTESDTDADTEEEELEVIDVKEQRGELNSGIEPSDIFIDFVLEIESQNWVFDTARVNKVGLYNLRDVATKSFRSRPFYDLRYDQTLVHAALRSSSFDEMAKTNRAFSEADQIWGYFYRDKDGEGMISDGVVEQWIYPNASKARSAFDYFEKHGNIIFFNTMPFFHQEGESVYIFHARAMAFSYDQKPLFEMFLERFSSE